MKSILRVSRVLMKYDASEQIQLTGKSQKLDREFCARQKLRIFNLDIYLDKKKRILTQERSFKT